MTEAVVAGVRRGVSAPSRTCEFSSTAPGLRVKRRDTRPSQWGTGRLSPSNSGGCHLVTRRENCERAQPGQIGSNVRSWHVKCAGVGQGSPRAGEVTGGCVDVCSVPGVCTARLRGRGPAHCSARFRTARSRSPAVRKLSCSALKPGPACRETADRPVAPGRPLGGPRGGHVARSESRPAAPRPVAASTTATPPTAAHGAVAPRHRR